MELSELRGPFNLIWKVKGRVSPVPGGVAPFRQGAKRVGAGFWEMSGDHGGLAVSASASYTCCFSDLLTCVRGCQNCRSWSCWHQDLCFSCHCTGHRGTKSPMMDPHWIRILMVLKYLALCSTRPFSVVDKHAFIARGCVRGRGP